MALFVVALDQRIESMKRRHRKMHKTAWILLAPALLLLVALGSDTNRDSTPANDDIAHMDKAVPLQ